MHPCTAQKVAPVCDGKQTMHLISALTASCEESEINGAELRPHLPAARVFTKHHICNELMTATVACKHMMMAPSQKQQEHKGNREGSVIPVPLDSNRCCSIQGKLPHYAFLQVFLLPLGNVGFQGQDPLLLLSQMLHECSGVILRGNGSTALSPTLTLQWAKKAESRAS